LLFKLRRIDAPNLISGQVNDDYLAVWLCSQSVKRLIIINDFPAYAVAKKFDCWVSFGTNANAYVIDIGFPPCVAVVVKLAGCHAFSSK
jgi:hypothetical protein